MGWYVYEWIEDLALQKSQFWLFSFFKRVYQKQIIQSIFSISIWANSPDWNTLEANNRSEQIEKDTAGDD